jgi:hypothetical protein
VVAKSVPDHPIPVRRRLSFELFLISLVVLFLGVIICDAPLLMTPFNRPDPAQSELLIASVRSSLFPEPLERISFLACLVLLPPLLFWHVVRLRGAPSLCCWPSARSASFSHSPVSGRFRSRRSTAVTTIGRFTLRPSALLCPR